VETLLNVPAYFATLPADRFEMAMRARRAAAEAAAARSVPANPNDEEECAVKKSEVKIGQEYLCKIGRNDVRVTAVSAPAVGAITLKTVATNKTIKIADPARLSPAPGKPVAKGAEIAPTAAAKSTTTKTTKTTAERASKKTGLLDAAVAVLTKMKVPMNCPQIINEMRSSHLYEFGKGLTPAATLYASILREIQKKGGQARFKKVQRGYFELSK